MSDKFYQILLAVVEMARTQIASVICTSRQSAIYINYKLLHNAFYRFTTVSTTVTQRPCDTVLGK